MYSTADQRTNIRQDDGKSMNLSGTAFNEEQSKYNSVPASEHDYKKSASESHMKFIT